METTVADVQKLTSFLDRYDILYKHQYDFQSGKSTGHAILYLTYILI